MSIRLFHRIKSLLANIIYPPLFALARYSWQHDILSNWERRFWDKYYMKAKRRYTKDRGILTKEQKREILSFFAPWCKVGTAEHAFYAEKTGVYSPLYMPDGMYYTVIDRFYNDWRLAHHLDNKCLYARLLPDVPLPRHIAYRVSGFWQDSEYRPLTEDALYELLRKEDEIVIKLATDSLGGHGVSFVRPAELQRDTFMSIFRSQTQDYAIQASLKQSPILGQLNPSSVNTIRLISYLGRDGEVTIYSCVLRMGIGAARADNASSGGIVAGICPDGRLKPCAYTTQGTKYDKVHPRSGVAFEDVVIPHYGEVQEMIKRAHHLLPQFRLLSWDVAIDENNQPVLIEVNMSIGELDFHQLTNGPIFGKDTSKILDEVFCKP